MSKLTGDEIIERIRQSRREDYQYEERWTDLETIGLSEKYTKVLGVPMLEESREQAGYFSGLECVWHFPKHNVFIRGCVSDGSYGNGYRLDAYDLKQVYPKQVEITVYEE